MFEYGEVLELEEVKREVHDILFFFSTLLEICSSVGDGMRRSVLPDVDGGNGETEAALGIDDFVIGLACVGIGKENGKLYLPGTNRPSNFFFSVSFASGGWRGSPIDLSQRVSSCAKIWRHPSE
jgi:hypothetical protein